MELPDRRKNTYEALEKRLDHHLEVLEDRFEMWFRRGLIAFAIIGIACAASIAGFGYLLHQATETSLRACTNRNVRHDNAVTALMAGSNQDQANAPSEDVRTEIRRRRDVTLGIIDGISPKVDCKHPGKVALLKPQITPPPQPKAGP